MAVAVIWTEKPIGTVGVNGVTWICVMVALVTVSIVLPVTPMNVAEIVAVPTAIPVARPRDPAAVLTAATIGLDETQVAIPVTLVVDASEKIAVAWYCTTAPTLIF